MEENEDLEENERKPKTIKDLEEDERKPKPINENTRARKTMTENN